MKEKEESKTMEQLMTEIHEITKKQKSSSCVDEIRVMRMMLNDPEYKVLVYDKNKGLIGTRCPHDEAVKFISNSVTSITGLDSKSAVDLTASYEFSKKDAMFFLDNMRDFTGTYLSSGRKLPIVQSTKSEAAIFYRPMPAKEKNSNTNSGVVNLTPAYEKVICRSKSPKYNSAD